MDDLFLGIVAIAVGALFCFRGYLALRVIIPIWGAFAGFFLGAGLIASATGDGFLRTALAWIVGLAVAMVFGLLAYLYYEISVLLAMSAIGFALGTGVMAALGFTWSWLIVLVGVLAGMALALIAIVGNLPMLLLTVLSTLAGASTIVAGTMLLAGTVDTDDLASATTTEDLGAGWWWYALYAALVVAGLVAQLRAVDRFHGSLRDSWAEAGGRELRSP